MPETAWLRTTSPAFRLMIATSWLAPESWQMYQAEAIREAISAGVDWTEYLSLVVDRHRTPALSWAALARLPGLEIPEAVKRQLKNYSDACRMQAVNHCLFLAEVLRSFNRAGILVMVLKGPLLSSEIYGDVGLRQSKDLDLAVAQEDVSRAQSCLNDLGWRLDSTWFPMTPRQWESCLQHESQLGFEQPRAGCALELHWRNWWDTPKRTADCWSRSIPTIWQGCPNQAMDLTDLVLYLCSHGGQHFWSRAKWLGDLARLHASGRVDWRAAFNESQRKGQERTLLTALHVLEQVYGLPCPQFLVNSGTAWLSPLVRVPLQALLRPEEPLTSVADKFRVRFHISRYQRQLRPEKSLRESFSFWFYRRDDFRDLPLPDTFFWAYKPLRPFLWVWRLARHGTKVEA